jgi:NAD(P)-dependent dehydrogenase (short-subunit alcohol dehydrogenase family)
VESDAADERQVADLFASIARSHGHLDVLFLDALIAPLEAFRPE